jgi:hypothetical protein
MRLRRPTTITAAFLIVAVSVQPSLFSQTPPRRSRPRQSPRADALAPAINELLKLDPLDPILLVEKDSNNPGAKPEEERKPPADDAPIKELTDYWSDYGRSNAAAPSDKVRRRLIEAVEDHPELIHRLSSFLPRATDTYDRLYKLFAESSPDDRGWAFPLRSWLQSNSEYFRDELIAEARREIAGERLPAYQLRKLAEIDWEAAKPLVEPLASSGSAQIASVALSLLYERAQQEGDSSQVEKYRALLKAIVVTRRVPVEARHFALSSLAKADWDGQQDWIVSLFADPSLGGLTGDSESKDASDKKSEKAEPESYPEESTLVLSALLGWNSEKWAPVISGLVGHNLRAVHQSAVRCLAEYLDFQEDDERRKEVARKLAPWLTDPDWAGASGRSGYIRSLVFRQEPELTPGLIWVLEHDEDEENRATAAEALTNRRDPRAVPALRRALEVYKDERRRENIVIALAMSGGFSDDEMAEAIEAYAGMVVTQAGEEEIDQAMRGESEKPLSLKISIGRILNNSDKIHATEELAVRLIERAKSLRASRPAVARLILRRIEDEPLRAAEINMVERIGAGWIDLDALKLALQNHRSLRKSAGDELYRLIEQGGYAAGVAAAVLDDEREQRETLAGADTKAQLALLAGARYLRGKLPVELAGKLLNSTNRALAKAAESYLEVEDSAEARKLVLARRRGEAYILGDITPLANDPYFKSVREWEEAMRDEIKSDAGLEAIYAMAQPGSPDTFKAVVIRVRGGTAEISLHDVEGRREVRHLTGSEFEELKIFTSRQEVEDLGPANDVGGSGSAKYEYLRLTKDGGRRIVLERPRRAPKEPTLHEELSGLFYRLSKSGEYVTRYTIEDKIPGVEILLSDRKQEAKMVCGEGREIRVLLGEKQSGYGRSVDGTTLEWREFSSGAAGKVTDEPSACRLLSWIPVSINTKHYSGVSLPTRSGNALIYVMYGEDSGVWKLAPGAEPVKIVSGVYRNPVVTPDGKWMVAQTPLETGGASKLIRHNLQTGKEFPVTITDNGNHPPITYIAAIGKVLLGQGPLPGVGVPGSINYLLAPETGSIQQVKGDFRPLGQIFGRELQPAGNPGEFWAAIHDSQKSATDIGRYDSRNFIFTPVVNLPGLRLNNSDFWVDATAGKIWFTYQGQLLRIPLPPPPKPK